MPKTKPDVNNWTPNGVNRFIKIWKEVDPVSSQFIGTPTLEQKRKGILALYEKKPRIYSKVTKKFIGV